MGCCILAYLKNLEEKKPVVVCGDLNVAHQEIDLKNPKSNYNKTPGYTQAEIDGMTTMIEAGFVDTFPYALSRYGEVQLVELPWWCSLEKRGLAFGLLSWSVQDSWTEYKIHKS